MRRALAVLLPVLLLGACATDAGFDLTAVDRALTPEQASRNIETARGHKVQWGGVVVNARNLKDATQIEILAYPLARGGRPKPDAAPLGRFLAVRSGYLETVDYGPGREVTVVGEVQEARSGTVGEAHYTFPVVDVEQIRLWPLRYSDPNPRFHFDIGVGIIR